MAPFVLDGIVKEGYRAEGLRWINLRRIGTEGLDPTYYGLLFPDLDLPVLWKTLEHIEAHPEEHDQSAWLTESSCGTSYCFAGMAAVLTGASFVSVSPTLVEVGGARFLVWLHAASVLGLNEVEANVLFSPNNTVGDLRFFVEALEAAELERLG